MKDCEIFPSKNWVRPEEEEVSGWAIFTQSNCQQSPHIEQLRPVGTRQRHNLRPHAWFPSAGIRALSVWPTTAHNINAHNCSNVCIQTQGVHSSGQLHSAHNICAHWPIQGEAVNDQWGEGMGIFVENGQSKKKTVSATFKSYITWKLQISCFFIITKANISGVPYYCKARSTSSGRRWSRRKAAIREISAHSKSKQSTRNSKLQIIVRNGNVRNANRLVGRIGEIGGNYWVAGSRVVSMCAWEEYDSVGVSSCLKCRWWRPCLRETGCCGSELLLFSWKPGFKEIKSKQWSKT